MHGALCVKRIPQGLSHPDGRRFTCARAASDGRNGDRIAGGFTDENFIYACLELALNFFLAVAFNSSSPRLMAML